jgi:hypothetical protein
VRRQAPSTPAAIASNAVNSLSARRPAQLLVERTAPWTVHAVTSEYARVHAAAGARPHGRVLALTARII